MVDDFGGTRSDPGMLGSGIYFAGSARLALQLSHGTQSKVTFFFSLSCKYSKPGKHGRRTRLMLVNEVALGQCKVRSLCLWHAQCGCCMCFYSPGVYREGV